MSDWFKRGKTNTHVENTGWVIGDLLPSSTSELYSNIKKGFINTNASVKTHACPLCITLIIFLGPPTRSRLEEQQFMGVIQPHDQQGSQSADELRTKPQEGLYGMSHITSIHSPEAVWVTEQCSGNITKTLLNFCLSFCPFIFLSIAHPTPPLMSHSQLSVPPKSNSCCGLR